MTTKESKYTHTYISGLFNESLEYKLDTSATSYGSDDYLHKVFIKINLPAIYSSSSRQFRWIKHLGYNIIKELECNIKFKNADVDRNISLYTYTEWLYIWNELNLSEDEKKLHNELIGNIPELYDPANAFNRNNAYPASHLNEEKYRWIINDNNLNKASSVNVDIDYNYNKPPSIPPKTLYIPLNLYFCNSIKDILPLEIIDNIIFKLELRDVTELYTVLLQPEDFILQNSINVENIDNETFNQNVKLPSSIKFLSNKIPNFNSSAHITDVVSTKDDLSIFDVLINKYEIKPLKTGNTAINHFLLGDLNPVSNKATNESTKDKFYRSLCNISIMCDIVKYKPYDSKNKVKMTGLFNTINTLSILITNTDENGEKTQHTQEINSVINNKIDEMFLIVRHIKRTEKNDLLNFTNLDHYNVIPWEDNNKNNTISYSSNIQLLTNSIWEHKATSSSIKIGVDNLGVFYIKKHILDNNVFKYVDVINYKSEETVDNKQSIYNVNSHKLSSEAILKAFKTTIYTNDGDTKTITSDAETYNFYNKVNLYKKYKNTVQGLYYINNSFNSLKKIELSECSFNRITIDNSDDYQCILFCIESKTIS